MAQNYSFRAPVDKEYEDRVIQVNRVTKKTGGGNKMGFSVLVVVGNRKGKVGAGLGKAKDVMSSVQKATTYAKKHMITVPLHDERTVPHRIEIKYGAARMFLKPAPKGSGIIAGGAARAILELAGVKDVVAKRLGTNNKITNVYATLEALKALQARKQP